jgi:hypothetical protein
MPALPAPRRRVRIVPALMDPDHEQVDIGAPSAICCTGSASSAAAAGTPRRGSSAAAQAHDR